MSALLRNHDFESGQVHSYLKPSAGKGAGERRIEMGQISNGRVQHATDVKVDMQRLEQQDAPKGMILPFQRLALTFHNVCYYVDMPPVSVIPSSANYKQ